MGEVSLRGIRTMRQEALGNLPARLSQGHQDGSFHIHDLEAFGQAPNCLTVDLKRCFPGKRFAGMDEMRKVLGIFDFLREAITTIAAEQTGGIGFANVDNDIAWICSSLGVVDSPLVRDLLRAGVHGLIDWINTTRTRYGLECYYVTFNLGLCMEPLGRHITACILDAVGNSPASYVRPNVVFKVQSAVNGAANTPNRDLFERALATTAERMVPTYLLCESSPNIAIAPDALGVMGCRSRVAVNVHGPTTTIGRGNLAYISINLPRLAWQARSTESAKRIGGFIDEWERVAEVVAELLLLRRERLMALPPSAFPGHVAVDPWFKPFSEQGMVSVWQHGTLSVGFVGLAEAVQIITGLRFGVDRCCQKAGLEMAAAMRSTIDRFRDRHKTNFTLLATSAELAAGRFAAIDAEVLHIPQAQKGFYTNSFHVPVEVEIGSIEKLQWEGPFHRFCNGGCISYVECAGPPIGNTLAIEDLVATGVEAGVGYLGLNFPRDVCRDCQQAGIFDVCPVCQSADVSHIRRVSGYLEELSGFTPGKQTEVRMRTTHIEDYEHAGHRH